MALFDAFGPSRRDELYVENPRGIIDHLTKTHGFALSSADCSRPARFDLQMFFRYGPALTYLDGTGSAMRTTCRDYASMLTSTDLDGQSQSYLATKNTSDG